MVDNCFQCKHFILYATQRLNFYFGIECDKCNDPTKPVVDKILGRLTNSPSCYDPGEPKKIVIPDENLYDFLGCVEPLNRKQRRKKTQRNE